MHVKVLSSEMFPGRIISLRGDLVCPPRSPGLSPGDYFWGAIYKICKVYANSAQAVDALKAATLQKCAGYYAKL